MAMVSSHLRDLDLSGRERLPVGQQSSVASVTGLDSFDGPVADDDPSHYFGPAGARGYQRHRLERQRPERRAQSG